MDNGFIPPIETDWNRDAFPANNISMARALPTRDLALMRTIIDYVTSEFGFGYLTSAERDNFIGRALMARQRAESEEGPNG